MKHDNITPLHRGIRPTTAERRMVDVETAARETFGCHDLDGPPRHVAIYDDWAMPSARAATPSGPSLLRVSGIAGIAIAAASALYFAAQLVRGAL